MLYLIVIAVWGRVLWLAADGQASGKLLLLAICVTLAVVALGAISQAGNDASKGSDKTGANLRKSA